MRRYLGAATAVALLLSACSSTGLPAGLTGNTYVAESVTGHTLVPGTTITLEFDTGRLAADAGCNHMSGKASLQDHVLQVDALAMTEMACEPSSRMDQDTWLADFLTSGPQLEATGSLFTLSNDGVAIVFVRTTSGTAGPVGTDWELTSTITGTGQDAVASSVPSVRKKTVLKLSDTRASLMTPCGDYSGEVSVTSTTLVITGLSPSTTPAPQCSKALRQVRDAALTALVGTVTYVIDAGTLTITSADGQHGLVFMPRRG